MKKMRTIKIDRNRWLNREASNKLDIVSSLYNKKTDTACCLGHAIHSISKCSWKELESKYTPNEYYAKATKKNPFIMDTMGNSDFSDEAIRINDSCLLRAEEREDLLKKLFKKRNLKLVFHGKFTKGGIK